jgi:hypothetical protein
MSQAEDLSHEEKFCLKLCATLDHVATVVDRIQLAGIDRGVFEFAKTVLQSMNKEKIINSFIERTSGLWGQLKDRQDEALVHNLSILLSGLSEEKQKLICDVFVGSDENGKRFLTDKELEIFWSCMHDFVRRSIMYIHYKRCPVPCNPVENKGMKMKYSQACHGGLSIKALVLLYEIPKIAREMGYEEELLRKHK